ncbi:class I SAM-dependent methyltransferase [Micromonospora ureilytica]|uniref:class I SAM-dependent methyltransferase n=1 Tax=Micromonospora ureilytica TaxID=709868 RepID=UPI004039F0CC
MRAAFEDLRPGVTYDLVYAAAALHWTTPEGRWSRVAALLEPGGVFASRDYVGHLSTISAYLELPTSTQEQVFSQIEQVLPETVELSADVIVHLARRRPGQ